MSDAVSWHAVYEEIRMQVGQVSRHYLGHASALQFQRFAVAAGDTNERYFSDEVAKRAGFIGVVAPPLFLSAIMGWEAGPEEADLRPDGTGHTETAALPVSGLRLMGAGQELELLEPVVDGCEVTEEISVDGVQLKQGKSGPMLIFSLLRRYVDQDGRELTRCRESFIAR